MPPPISLRVRSRVSFGSVGRLAVAFDEVADDVVHDAAIGRLQLDAADPDVFLQVGRDGDVDDTAPCRQPAPGTAASS